MTTAEDILDAMQQQVGPGFTAGPVIEAVRMSRATLDDLSRQIGPPDPRLNLSLEGAQLWGIRILVDEAPGLTLTELIGEIDEALK